MQKILYKAWHKTPLGMMLSVSDLSFLYLLEFENRKNLTAELEKLNVAFLTEKTVISEQLNEELRQYFAGKLTRFDTPIRWQGTEFQRKVWQTVQKIPYGMTSTYKEIAVKIGKPHASLAVGAANGANQFALVVPCHRLVKSDGGLAGYAAGLDKKKWLLEFEKNGYKN